MGEFRNGYNTYTTHVDGDKDPNSDKPLFLDFTIPADFTVFSGAIRKGLTIVTLGTAVLISYM